MKIIFQENTLKAMQKSLFVTNSKSVNTKGKKDGKFRYFQNKIIEHLTKLEKEAQEITKSFSYVVDSIVKSKFPVGTIRTWKGKNYIKVAQGKWKT